MSLSLESLSTPLSVTSRAFAAVLIASSKCWGNRNEIVLVEGFRLGNIATCASLQSRCSEESFLSGSGNISHAVGQDVISPNLQQYRRNEQLS